MQLPKRLDPDRIRRVARLYSNNHDAGRALGIRAATFARLCQRFGIEQPAERKRREHEAEVADAGGSPAMSATLGAPSPCTSGWAHGPWAGCHTADEYTERLLVLNRHWWEQGGWLTYLYYRIMEPTPYTPEQMP